MKKISKLVIGTNNKGKYKEIKDLLPKYIKTYSTSEYRLKSPIEDGLTFTENSIIKSKHFSKKTSLICLADDSGLEVEVLDGEPGIYSARYAREGATDEENVKKLLLKMEGHNNRKAHFCCAMVYINDEKDTKPIIIERRWEGEILREPIGTNGFGYDPIFYLKDYSCSSAQLEPDIKNKISHRGQALDNLLSQLLRAE